MGPDDEPAPLEEFLKKDVMNCKKAV